MAITSREATAPSFVCVGRRVAPAAERRRIWGSVELLLAAFLLAPALAHQQNTKLSLGSLGSVVAGGTLQGSRVQLDLSSSRLNLPETKTRARSYRLVPTWKAAVSMTPLKQEVSKFQRAPIFQQRPSKPSTKAAAAPRKVQPKYAFPAKGISFHGGKVMPDPINVYIAWIGVITEAQKNLVRNFIASLSPSTDATVTVDDWWFISAHYYSSNTTNIVPRGGFVTRSVVLAGEYPPKGSRVYASTGVNKKTKQLTSVQWALMATIRAAKWKMDPTAIYVAFSDSSVTQVGVPGVPGGGGMSCQQYCGWHSNFVFFKQNLKFLWVGIPPCTGCGYQGFSSNGGPYEPPSLDAGIHQAISTLAHELTETASNPDGYSWYDSNGYENADKCSYRYGTVTQKTLPNGKTAVYNMVGLNGVEYLVQMNFNPVTAACVQGM